MAFSSDVYRARGGGFEPPKKIFQASEYLQHSGMKRGLLLHWEQWGKRENAGWQEGRVQWDPGEKH